jgi:hypothetical protein
MSSLRRRAFLLALLSAIVAAACSEPPEKEMSQAQGAIDAARAAGADRYAVDEYKAAVDALARSREAVTLRDYRLALSLALDARERAQDAARVAATRRAAIRSEVEGTARRLTASLERAQERLKAAQAARVPASDLAGSRTAIAEAERAVQETLTLLVKDEDLEAKARIDGVQPRIDAALQAIERAIAARAARRRR